jgi:predicted SnoaL-like aldol condensation-catalyzing enzyme
MKGDETMITEQWFEEYNSSFVNAINAGDWDAVDKLVDKYVADQYIAHLPGVSSPVRGPEGLKQYFHNVIRPMQGFHTELQEVFAIGDKGASRFKGRNTDPATGKVHHWTTLMFSHFKGDKAVEEWEVVGEWEDEA